MKLKEIIERHHWRKQLKPSLQKRYPISELALFGSVASDEHAEASDIGILVDFNGSIGIGFF
ncbi:nucleotidyltransferase family protein [Parapedobacter soli]|uniref:nucleotidyltransferase family protein n=1 Tax=Parapedobacter soli TaxID=416955 RepID=UPI0021C76863|nr:nucleotidyltransferase domain-containing protein [Parapedobacter soli]